jgi:hypothetical protein
MMSSKFVLSIASYYRGTDWKTQKDKPYHWSFFIRTGPNNDPTTPGIAHQLRGMPGNFFYPGPEKVSLSRSTARKETLDIGEIPAAKLNRVTELLRQVNIIKDEASFWNCQDWSLDALEKLAAEGFVMEGYTSEVVKNWLREQDA